MSISVIEARRRKIHCIVYLSAAVLCIIFNAVYGLFGHGVASPYMSAMFIYPLSAGLLVFFFFTEPTRLFVNLFAYGTATLTVGSCVHGIMDIAGTDTPYQIIFTLTGWLFIASATAAYIYGIISNRKKRRRK